MHYKGYKGSVEYSSADCCLFGKVLDLCDTLILYEGSTLTELKKDFETSIDNYLDDCIEDSIPPEKPFKPVSVIHVATPVMATM